MGQLRILGYGDFSCKAELDLLQMDAFYLCKIFHMSETWLGHDRPSLRSSRPITSLTYDVDHGISRRAQRVLPNEHICVPSRIAVQPLCEELVNANVMTKEMNAHQKPHSSRYRSRDQNGEIGSSFALSSFGRTDVVLSLT